MINILLVDMYSTVIFEFPELYTKKGKLSNKQPKKYECSCGFKFNKTKMIKFNGVGFNLIRCEKCGRKGHDSLSYNVWKRMINGQIKQEDFILNEIIKRKTILKKELLEILDENFDYKTDAIGTLCYFGYINVDKDKRDDLGIIEYNVNFDKDLNRRYELIR